MSTTADIGSASTNTTPQYVFLLLAGERYILGCIRVFLMSIKPSQGESESLSHSILSLRSKIKDLENQPNPSESLPIYLPQSQQNVACKLQNNFYTYCKLPKLIDPPEDPEQLPLPLPKRPPSTPDHTPSINEISKLKTRSYRTAQLLSSGDASQIKKSERMFGCGDHIIDVNGRVITSYCRAKKLCAICADKDLKTKTAILRSALTHDSFKQPYSWAVITLSLSNCYPHEIKEQTTHLHKSFSRLMSYQAFKRVVMGYIRSTEITENKNIADSANIHMHALIAVNTAYHRDSYISSNLLKKLWSRASKRSKSYAWKQSLKWADHEGEMDAVLKFNSYIMKGVDPINKKPSRESKPRSPLSDPFKLELSKQWSGVRLLSYGGTIKDAVRAQKNRYKLERERLELERERLELERERLELERLELEGINVELHTNTPQKNIRKFYSHHSSIASRYPDHQHYKWDRVYMVYRPLKSSRHLHHKPPIEHQIEPQIEPEFSHPNLFISME